MIDIKNHHGEIARAIRNKRFERTDDGRILIASAGLFIGGALKVKDYRDGSDQLAAIDANMLLDEGINHILNVTLPPAGGYAQITQWYFAPFSGNYTPDPTHDASELPTASTEFTAYTSTTRLPLNIQNLATAKTTGNTGNEVQLIFNAGGPYHIYGCNIVSASAKGSTTGKALASVRLASPKLGLTGGEKIGLEYVLSAADAG